MLTSGSPASIGPTDTAWHPARPRTNSIQRPGEVRRSVRASDRGRRAPRWSLVPPSTWGLVDGRRDSAALQCARNDQSLDLAGALPDPVHPQLAKEPLGHVGPRVAATSKDLHRAVRAAVRGLG